MTKARAYINIGTACNQKCLCCPCNQTSSFFIPFSELKIQVDHMIDLGVKAFVISGGEPTIHPDFLELLKYILSMDCAAYVLSNGEKMDDPLFRRRFIEITKDRDVTVTTTLHSHLAELHEFQNGSPGSFSKSVNGLLELDRNGIRISVKHCITALNYRSLTDFIGFVANQFSNNTEIQLWGLDFAGMDEKTSMKYRISYDQLKPVIEEALDTFENMGYNQTLNINNLPLCLTDPYYWRYFSEPSHEEYLEPDGNRGIPNHGPASSNCRECPVREWCMGTYITAFQRFGDDIVSQPDISFLTDIPTIYQVYDESNIGLMYFSPYTDFSFSKSGLIMTNRRVGIPISIRCHSETLGKLLRSFIDGVDEEEAEKICLATGRKELFEDLVYFGVVE